MRSIGKTRYLECDGPNGIDNLMAGFLAGIKGNMYTNQFTLAQTWNPELAFEKGEFYGRETKEYGVAGRLSEELKNSAFGQQAMRQATKNILYMADGSDVPQLYQLHMSTLGAILLGVLLVLMLLFAQYYIR